MKNWYLIIDVAKCLDCNTCFIACNDEHEGNDWPGYTLAQPRHNHRWMNVMRTERGQFPLIDVSYRPTPCMQCQNAPCVKASNGAIIRREDGIILIDPEKAKGKKEIVSLCPYGAIYWNEESHVPQKCTMCAHLLDDGWAQPRCVQACFTGAMRAEFLGEEHISELIQREGLEQLHPERNTNPNVYYKNLYRFDKVFVAGSIAVKNGEVVDCCQGVKVSLYHNDQKIDEAISDAFGDFRFDRLAKDSGSYIVKFERNGFSSKSQQVLLKESVNLGTIFL